MIQGIVDIDNINIDDVIEKFVYKFKPCGKLIAANGTIHVYFVERFYFRMGSEVAATVIFELNGKNDIAVHIAIAGGRDMFGVSLGAQDSMFKRLKNFFRKLDE